MFCTIVSGEVMNKLIIGLIGIALLLVATAPVMAHTMINQGAIVYVGERGLDLTNAINHYPVTEQKYIGWWVPGRDPATFKPSVIVGAYSRKSLITIDRVFATHLGNWYMVRQDGTANTTDGSFFTVRNTPKGAPPKK